MISIFIVHFLHLRLRSSSKKLLEPNYPRTLYPPLESPCRLESTPLDRPSRVTYREKGRDRIVRTGAMHFCGRAASPLLGREHGHGFSAFHATEKKEQTDLP